MKYGHKVWVDKYKTKSTIGTLPAKGTVLWAAAWWPWAKVSVHEIAVEWIRKSNLQDRS